MNIEIKKIRVQIEWQVIILVILSLTIKKVADYFSNYYICYLFIVFHELSHITLAAFLGIKVERIKIKLLGLKAQLDNSSNNKNILWLSIYLAGPIANAILAIIFRKIEMVHAINLALCIMNLLPVYPLDGYHILSIILKVLKIKKVEFTMKIIQYVVSAFLYILGIMQLIIFKNPSIIFMAIYIFLQYLKKQKSVNTSIYQKYYKNVTNF